MRDNQPSVYLCGRLLSSVITINQPQSASSHCLQGAWALLEIIVGNYCA